VEKSSAPSAINHPGHATPAGKPPHGVAFWIGIMCLVLAAITAPFAYLQYGPLPIQVETSSTVIVDYINTTGSWPITMTSYQLNVSVCATFHGWTGGTYSCTFTVSNPMNVTQYYFALGFHYGWVVPGNRPTLTIQGSNVTGEPNGTVAMMPHTGELSFSVSARLPEQGGGDFTNHVLVGMIGWGCYTVPCAQG